MNLKNKVNIHNRFDIEVRDAETGLLKKSLTSYNIVLNQMYTRLCGGSAYFANIHFGSGSGSLSPTRTSLFSHLGTKTAVNDTLVKSIPLSTWKRKIVLNPEEYVGKMISEVGVAFGATSTNLVTHSLLKDSEGNPISIVKTDTDVITIYATVFVTFDTSNPNLVYLGMPSSNALVNYLIGGESAPTGVFNLNDAFFGYSVLGSTANATWTSDTANKQRKTNVLRFGTTVGNGQVKYLEFTNLFSLKFPYSPVFNGYSYEGMSLGVGDGVKVKYPLLSVDVKDVSIVVKKNGVVVNPTEYVLNKYLGHYRNGAIIHTNARSLCMSKNGLFYVVGDTYADIRFYELIGDSFVARPAFPVSSVHRSKNVSSFGISNDGSSVCFVDTDGYNFYNFVWNGTTWSRFSNPPSLGQAAYNNKMAFSSDGKVLAVGTYAPPYGNVYDRVGTSWVKRPDPYCHYYGISSELTPDGNTVIFGASESTNGFSVSDWNGTAWTRRADPGAIGAYASQVAITDDGLRVAVPTSSGNKLSVFDWVDGAWVRLNVGDTNLGVAGQSACFKNGGNTLYFGSYRSTGIDLKVYDWNGTSFVKRRTEVQAALSDIKGVGVVPNSENVIGYTGTTALSLEGRFITEIVFNTPPAIGDVITADYTVDGVHKTNQHVIDVSFVIQFGEGS